MIGNSRKTDWGPGVLINNLVLVRKEGEVILLPKLQLSIKIGDHYNSWEGGVNKFTEYQPEKKSGHNSETNKGLEDFNQTVNSGHCLNSQEKTGFYWEGFKDAFLIAFRTRLLGLFGRLLSVMAENWLYVKWYHIKLRTLV